MKKVKLIMSLLVILPIKLSAIAEHLGEGRISILRRRCSASRYAQAEREEQEINLYNLLNKIVDGCLKAAKEQLNKRSLDINAKTKKGSKVLHEAISYNRANPEVQRFKIIQLLLDSGAKINAQDSDGNTPLHKAVESMAWIDKINSVDVIWELLKRGASVDIKNKNNQTSYDVANIFHKRVIDNYFANPRDIKSDIESMFDSFN